MHRTPTDRQQRSGMNWRFAVRALRHRNYRLFFGGQGISLIGTWMTRVATGWLVYRLTGSAFLLGLVSFCGQIPILVLGPMAGVWVDRWNRHRVLLVTQVLSMLQSFGLAVLALTGTITVTDIILLNLFQGAINAFDMPARQAFVIEMVERREDLGSAIAMNSSLVNAARLIGPSVAGLLIAAVGEGYCFLADGFSYMAVIASLLAMSVALRATPRTRQSVRSELREGWDYVRSFRPIWSILLLLALVSLVGLPYTALLPIFAATILHGGPHVLGFLTAAAGVGALIGAVTLASRQTLGLARVIPISAGLVGAALIAFAASRQLWLSLSLLLVTGFGFMQQLEASNTILQTVTEDKKRGRVMSFYSMAFQGMSPVGALIAGTTASRIGAPFTLMVGGAICICGAAWFAWHLPTLRQVVRPIYVQNGLVPEVATGVPAATVLQEPDETEP